MDQQPQEGPAPEYAEKLPEDVREVVNRIREEDAELERRGFPELTDDDIRKAEVRAKNWVKIKKIALTVLNPRDFNDLGGNPYLNEGGAHKVAGLFGVSFKDTNTKPFKTELDGDPLVGFVSWTVAEWRGTTIKMDGYADSNDQFFRMRNKERLPLSEVNLGNLRKKSVTNAMLRALKKLLGLGNLVWEDLDRTQIKRDQVNGVNYGASKAKRQDRSGSGGAGPKLRLKNILTDLEAWEGVPFLELLREYTVFQDRGGKDRSAQDVEKMSEAWAAKTLERVEPVWRDHPANGGPSQPTEEPRA